MCEFHWKKEKQNREDTIESYVKIKAIKLQFDKATRIIK